VSRSDYRLGYKGNTVRKYPNELVEFGPLERSQLDRESGGFVILVAVPN